MVIINGVILLSMGILYIYNQKQLASKLAQLKTYKEETDHKLDILIRVSHKHEQFIDTVKQLSEENQIRTRKVAR